MSEKTAGLLARRYHTDVAVQATGPTAFNLEPLENVYALNRLLLAGARWRACTWELTECWL